MREGVSERAMLELADFIKLKPGIKKVSCDGVALYSALGNLCGGYHQVAILARARIRFAIAVNCGGYVLLAVRSSNLSDTSIEMLRDFMAIHWSATYLKIMPGQDVAKYMFLAEPLNLCVLPLEK